MEQFLTKDKQPAPRKGFVAYFDVLGYSAIPAQLAFEKMKLLVSDCMRVRKGACETGQIISVSAFGDTVFAFAPMQSVIFTSFCRYMFSKAFDDGLPLRGAIAYGEYFNEGTIYAGDPINEAHNFANALEVCACVVTPTASRWLPLPDPENFVFLPIPLKVVGQQKLYALKPHKKYSSAKIINAFSEHGKTISPSVLPKLNNTIELFSHFSKPLKRN